MNESIQRDTENLCQALLDKAHQDAAELINKSKREAEALLLQVEDDQQEFRRSQLAEATHEANRRKEQILATVPIEQQRLLAARMETLLLTIHDETLARLRRRQGFDYHHSLITLASSALSRMRGTRFIIRVSPTDHSAWGTSLSGDIASHLGRRDLILTIVEDVTLHDGGVIVHDEAGQQEWDNQLPARFERLWPEIRQYLASSLFESASSHKGAS